MENNLKGVSTSMSKTLCIWTHMYSSRNVRWELENVKWFFLIQQGKEGKEADLKINEMLIDIQLIDKQNEKSRTLSGGMKRKLRFTTLIFT